MLDKKQFKLFFKNQQTWSRNLFKLFTPLNFAKLHGYLGKSVLHNWQQALMRLFPLGGTAAGNKVTLFSEGDELFFAIQQAIRSAKKSIWLETYIFEPDILGTRIRNALVDAAMRGVEVILLYDHFGSTRINQNFLEPLVMAGGKAFAFNPIWPWRRKGPLLFRNHRKILTIDNQIGFCGGTNISVDYAGTKLGNNRFRDTVVRLEGPGVVELSKIFLSSLKETTREEYSFEMDKNQLKVDSENGVFVQVLGSNTRRNLYAIQKSMEVTLKRATRYFTTPYFLPYDKLRKAILKAVHRGVDVRILTAGLSDVPLMRLASQCVYGQFLTAGIRVYEMFEKNLHAKTATIDGIYGTVGSYNLDHWSARRNLEVNVSIFDEKVAGDLEKQFYEDLKFCREVTMVDWRKRSLWQRIIHWIAYQIMRL
ncbi:MAG: phospholipase D-like domain-containing protein [bacterium]|nr:phospholipase D-like domain-containing protein [bacterium]